MLIDNVLHADNVTKIPTLKYTTFQKYKINSIDTLKQNLAYAVLKVHHRVCCTSSFL